MSSSPFLSYEEEGRMCKRKDMNYSHKKAFEGSNLVLVKKLPKNVERIQQ